MRGTGCESERVGRNKKDGATEWRRFVLKCLWPMDYQQGVITNFRMERSLIYYKSISLTTLNKVVIVIVIVKYSIISYFFQ